MGVYEAGAGRCVNPVEECVGSVRMGHSVEFILVTPSGGRICFHCLCYDVHVVTGTNRYVLELVLGISTELRGATRPSRISIEHGGNYGRSCAS